MALCLPHIFLVPHTVFLSSIFVLQVSYGHRRTAARRQDGARALDQLLQGKCDLLLLLECNMAKWCTALQYLAAIGLSMSMGHFIGGTLLDVWRRWVLASLMWTVSGCTTRSRCGSLSDGSTARAQQHWMPLPPLGLLQSMQYLQRS